jgi:hypothetical protein
MASANIQTFFHSLIRTANLYHKKATRRYRVGPVFRRGIAVDANFVS